VVRVLLYCVLLQKSLIMPNKLWQRRIKLPFGLPCFNLFRVLFMQKEQKSTEQYTSSGRAIKKRHSVDEVDYVSSVVSVHGHCDSRSYTCKQLKH